MKIISNFHDYYDRFASYTKGETVFVRKQDQGAFLAHLPASIHLTTKNGGKNATIEFGFVGFCGRGYPYLRVLRNFGYYEPTQIDYFYDYDSFAEKNPDLIDGTAKFQRGHVISAQIKDIKQYLSANGSAVNSELMQVFERHKCAYFEIISGRERNLSIHWPLEKVKFFKVFPFDQTYQEIEMFVNNFLFKKDNPRIDPVPDHIKAESHGFNKYSFRKDPSSRKKR